MKNKEMLMRLRKIQQVLVDELEDWGAHAQMPPAALEEAFQSVKEIIRALEEGR